MTEFHKPGPDHDQGEAPDQGERFAPSTEVKLPSLDQLTDAEYLEQSRAFGRQWVDFIRGKVSSEEEQSPLFQSLNAILEERSARYNQIPESERARTLINQQRELLARLMGSTGEPAPKYQPVSDELLERAEARAYEIRGGIPAVIINGNYKRELFQIESGAEARAFSWMLSVDESSFPFVALSAPGGSRETKDHETAHIAWRAVRQAIPSIIGLREARDKGEQGFVRAKEEGISISTAGEHQFTHSGTFAEMQRLGIDTSDYTNLDSLYSSVIAKTNPQDLTLGIMQANNFQDLKAHFERMARIVEPFPKIDRPEHSEFI